MVSSNINYATILNVFPGAQKQRGLSYSPDVHVPVPSRKLSITLEVSEFEDVPPNNGTFSIFDYTSSGQCLSGLHKFSVFFQSFICLV